MPILDHICDCKWCDCNVLYPSFRDWISKDKNIKNINESKIFNREKLIAARPSVIIPSGGKFESLDFHPPENSFTIDEEIKKGKIYLTGQFFTKCFLVILIGFFTGLSGAIIEYSMKMISCHKNAFLRSYLMENYEDNIKNVFLWGLLINLAFAFVGSYVVVFIEPAATGGGIAGLMGFLNGVTATQSVAFKVYLIKIISVICMSAASLPGGKEGPMIHIGGIIGASLPNMRIPFTKIRVFSNILSDTERRDLSYCGTAAGLSAAFATPLGSFLVPLEEFMSFWSAALFLSSFMTSIISAVTYVLLSNWFEGRLGHWVYTKNFLFLESVYEAEVTSFNLYSIPIWILIGVLGGLLGALWIFIHKQMSLLRKRFLKFKVLQLLEVLVWTTIVHCVYVSLLAYTSFCSDMPEHKIEQICDSRPHPLDLKMYCPAEQFPTMALFSLNDNGEIFESLFYPEPDIIALYPQCLMFIAYYLMSGFFSGAMISAGLFVPNMINGAAFGRALALSLRDILEQKNMWMENTVIMFGFYGSAALVSPVVKLFFSLSVVYCEGASTFILFVPVVVIMFVDKIVADAFIDGIYEVQYQLGGIPILCRYPPPHLGNDENALNVMSRFPVVYLTTPTTVRRLLQVTFESRHNGFPVVDTRYTSRIEDATSVGRLTGLILRSQIKMILKNQWVDTSSTTQSTDLELNVFRKGLADALTPRKAEKSILNLNSNVNLEAFMDATPFSVTWNTSLTRTYKIFLAVGIRHLVVVNNANEVIGMITRKDLAKYSLKYNITGFHRHIYNFN